MAAVSVELLWLTVVHSGSTVITNNKNMSDGKAEECFDVEKETRSRLQPQQQQVGCCIAHMHVVCHSAHVSFFFFLAFILLFRTTIIMIATKWKSEGRRRSRGYSDGTHNRHTCTYAYNGYRHVTRHTTWVCTCT